MSKQLVCYKNCSLYRCIATTVKNIGDNVVPDMQEMGSINTIFSHNCGLEQFISYMPLQQIEGKILLLA